MNNDTKQYEYKEIENEQRKINEQFDLLCDELKKLPIKKKKNMLNQLQKQIFKRQQIRRY